MKVVEFHESIHWLKLYITHKCIFFGELQAFPFNYTQKDDVFEYQIQVINSKQFHMPLRAPAPVQYA